MLDRILRYRAPSAAAAALCIFAGSACSPDATQGPGQSAETGETVRQEPSDSDRQIVASANDFTFALFGRAARSADEPNLVLSPLSASMALGMLLNGATGETRTQMESALRMAGIQPATINASYRDLRSLLTGLDEDVQLTIANAIFARRDVPFEQAFLDTTRSYFDATVRVLDFRDPATVDVINGWVRDQTNDRIDSMVEEIDSAAIMFLMNAIYFRGDWARAFDPERTRTAPFTRADGSTVDVPMMDMDEGRHLFAYIDDGTTLIDLPYARGAWSMTLLLPPQGQDALAFAAGLDRARWDQLVAQLDTVERVMVRMPRFTIEHERVLNEDLKALGMTRVFTDDAELDALTPQDAYVHEVKQKTYIAVDEAGTEAAAVTSVEVRAVSMPPHIFLDRPFLFAIRERTTGAILFLGVVGDPGA